MQFGMVDVVERREEEEEREKRNMVQQTHAGVDGKRQLRDDCQATAKARTWQEHAARLRKVHTRRHCET
jgi:hypothetical protein